MDDLEDRRQRAERDLERIRAKLAAIAPEDYGSEATYRRVRTYLQGRIAHLEGLLSALDDCRHPLDGNTNRRSWRCPRCGGRRARLYYLEGAPVPLCYACWVDLGREWWENRSIGPAPTAQSGPAVAPP